MLGLEVTEVLDTTPRSALVAVAMKVMAADEAIGAEGELARFPLCSPNVS